MSLLFWKFKLKNNCATEQVGDKKLKGDASDKFLPYPSIRKKKQEWSLTGQSVGSYI